MERHKLFGLCATVVSVALLVEGCAGQRAGPGVEKDIQTYCDEQYASPAIDPVRDKVQLPLSFDAPQSIDRLADRTKATDTERVAVKALWEARERCRSYSESKLGSQPTFRVRSEDRLSEALADLYEGGITYGQFARSMLYIGSSDKAARESLDEEIKQREKWRIFRDYDSN